MCTRKHSIRWQYTHPRHYVTHIHRYFNMHPVSCSSVRPMTQPQQPLSLLESFLCGGLAGCGAVTISKHPPHRPRPAHTPSQHPRDNEDPAPAPGRAPEERPLGAQSVPQCPRRVQEDVAARGYTRSSTRPGPRRKLSAKYLTPLAKLLFSAL